MYKDKDGNSGGHGYNENTHYVSCSGGTGGNTGYGVQGGRGAGVTNWTCGSPPSRNSAWIKIDRRNTNIQ